MPLATRCPLSLALEVIGDRWSLLIVRDLMFSDHRQCSRNGSTTWSRTGCW
jgi:DNA-binding HxlR family transcriptional regulator